jgi:hypothetical protein
VVQFGDSEDFFQWPIALALMLRGIGRNGDWYIDVESWFFLT